jgi:hypothetical protein
MARIFKKIISQHSVSLSLIVSLCLSLVSNTIVFPVSVAEAAFNKQINYQGKLTNTSNVAVTNGNYNMRFKLYTAATGGSPLWTEDDLVSNSQGITTNSGLFSVMLGSTTALTGIDFNQTLYLGVAIGGTTTVPVWDSEMTPRKVLGAVPAAFVADTIQGLNPTQFIRSDAANATSSASTYLSITNSGAGKIADFIGTGSLSALAILSNGNVGVGTTSPYAKLSVVGQAVAEYFTATSTSIASRFPYASSTAQTISGSLYLASLNGPLQANAGLISATSSIGVLYGGTGLTSAPTFGQMLVGNASSGYTLTATTSLGFGATFFQQNGNSFGTAAILGTNDAQSLVLKTNNVAKVTILSGGGVGFGLGSPSARIHTDAPLTGAISAIFQNGADNGNSVVQIVATNGVSIPVVSGIKASSNGLIFQTGSSVITTEGTDRLTILSTGNVGVATSTPFSKLSVTSTAGAPTTSLFAVASSTNATLFNVLGNGNVGIGTSNPGVALDVVGTIRTGVISITNTGNIGDLGGGGTGLQFFTDGGQVLTLTAGQQVGINATAPGSTFSVGGSASVGTTYKTLAAPSNGLIVQGSVGVGTSTPWKTFSVTGNMVLTGGFFDSLSSAGTNGMVLQSTGSATQWVATSTLGFGSGSGTVGSGTIGQFPYYAANGTTLTATSSLFLATSGNVGIGTTSPVGRLSIASDGSVNNQFLRMEDLGSGGKTFSIVNRLNSVAGTFSIYDITASASRLTIDTNGNVGIGTSSPLHQLTIASTANGGNLWVESNANNSGLVLNNIQSGGRQYEIDSAGGSATLASSLYINDITGSKVPFLLNSSGNLGLGGNITTNTLTGAALSILTGGNVGVGTTTPWKKFSVAGDMVLTGALFDSLASAGTNGMVLQTTGSATTWVATSTLGFLASTAIGAGTAGQFPYYAASGNNIVATSSLFLATTGNIGVGTTSPFAALAVTGQIAGSFFTGYGTATSTFGGPISSATSTLIVSSSGSGSGILLNPYNSGKVGIRVTNLSTLSEALQVNGNVRLTGTTNSITGSTLTITTPTVGSLTDSTKLVLTTGDTASGNPGNVYIYAGVASGGFGGPVASNVIIGHNGTTQLGKVSIGTSTISSTVTIAGGGPDGLTIGPSTAVPAFSVYGGNGLNGGAGGLINLEAGNGSLPDGEFSFDGGAGGDIYLSGGKGGPNGGGVDGRDGNILLNVTKVNSVRYGNVGIGTSSPYAKLSVVGQAVAEYFTATSTSIASRFPYASSTAQTISGSLYLASLNGPLQSNGGLVSATTSIGVLYGGTGLTSAPTYGQMLVGNSSGGYILTATSSLGLAVTNAGTTGQLPYYAANGTTLTATSSLFLATSGNVGVGTTSPFAKFSVAGQSVADYFTATSLTATSTIAGALTIGNPQYVYANAAANSFSVGFANIFNSTASSINASGPGSISFGTIDDTFIQNANIISSGGGSLAGGYVLARGAAKSITASNLGSVALGFISGSSGSNIVSSGLGSFAMGASTVAGTVTASGDSSVAWGQNITASNSLSFAFGSGYTNSTASTFNVGFGSTPTLTVNSTALGIGTTTPAARLAVTGSGTGTGRAFAIANSSNVDKFIVLDNGNAVFGTNASASTATPENVSFGGTYGSNTAGTVGNLKWDLYNDGAGTRYGIGMSAGLMEFQAGAGGGHAFYVNQGTEAMKISIGGNVGIGTTTPFAKLAVTTTASAPTTSLFAVASSTNATLFTVLGNGNVGIGTTTPISALEVVGSLTVSGGNSITTNILSNVGQPLTIAPGATGAVATVGATLALAGGSSGASTGGAVTLTSGTGSASAPSGNITISTPNGFSSGSINITGGNGSTVLGGSINLTSGSGSVPGAITLLSQGSGNINLTSGSTGKIILNGAAGGNVGIGTTSPYAMLSVAGQIVGAYFTGTTTATSTFGGGINITSGCFAVSGSCISTTPPGVVNSGTIGQFPYYAANGTTLTATSSLFLATSGNVGIGTTSPTAPLDVQGTGSGHVMIGQTVGLTGYGAISLNGSLSTTNFNFSSSNGDSNLYINRPSGRGVYIGENGGTAQLLIASGGNVGIGTTTPSAKLSVTGSGTGTGRAFAIANSSNAEKFTVLDNGNVGVGVQNPLSYKFDVNGAMHGTSLNTDSGVSVGGDLNVYGNLGCNLIATNYDALYGVSIGDIDGCSSNNYIKTDDGSTNATISASGNIYMLAFGGHAGVYGGLAVGTTYYGSVTPTNGAIFEGNVGIGTTTPAAKLAITGAGTGTGRAFTIANSSNAEKFTVLDNGSVGVGTTSPDSAFSQSSNTTGTNFHIVNSGVTNAQTALIEFKGGNVGSAGDASAVVRLASQSSLRDLIGMSSLGISKFAVSGAGVATINNSTVAVPSSIPNSYTASLLVHTDQVGGSRPLFFGYDNGSGTGWAGFITTGACGAYSTMCFDMGNGTTDYTALKNSGTTLQIGGTFNDGAGDGDFTDVVFGNSGKVGIGTTTPYGQLSINPTSANGTAPSFAIGSSTGTLFSVSNAGNVGIGAAAPSTNKLFIRSDGLASGTAWTEGQIQVMGTSNGNKRLQIGLDTTSSIMSAYLQSVEVGGAVRPINLNPQGGQVAVGPLPPSFAAAVFTVAATSDYTNPLSWANAFLNAGNTSKFYGSGYDTTLAGTNGAAFIQGFYAGSTANIPIVLAPQDGDVIIGKDGAAQKLLLPKANLGIGTTTPYARLSIQGTSTAPTAVLFSVASTSNTTYFNILAGGNVGIGTTSPSQKLTVQGGLCVTAGAACTAEVSGTIVADGVITQNAFDLAESYVTNDPTVSEGDVVAADPLNDESIVKATASSTVIGIVSTKPGFTLGNLKNGKPVALSGRVPVKVSMENGSIKRGDYLTLSATKPGYAMKATGPTNTIGTALQEANADGKVTAFVNVGWQNVGFNSNDPLPQTATMLGFLADTTAHIKGVITDKIVAIEGAFTRLTAQTIIVKNDDLSKTGITIYDRATGLPVCMYIENGLSKTSPGNCEDSTGTPVPPSNPNPPTNPGTTTPPVGGEAPDPTGSTTPSTLPEGGTPPAITGGSSIVITDVPSPDVPGSVTNSGTGSAVGTAPSDGTLSPHS